MGNIFLKSSQRNSNNNIKYELILTKNFDIKIKTGHSIQIVHIDENNYLKSLFFLKGKKIFNVNILTKKNDELNFSKNHEVEFFTGNNNNKYLIILFSNYKIFAIDSKKNIFYFKNIFNFQNKNFCNEIKNPKLFVNNDLSKFVIFTQNQIIIWYKSQIKEKNANNSNKKINELIGFHIYIQLNEERKELLKNENKFYFDDVHCIFNNSNNFLGSSIKIYYVLLITEENKTNITKIILVNYIFFFDRENKFKSIENDSNLNYEFKSKFSSKYIFSYLISNDFNDDEFNNENQIYNIKKKSF